MKSCYNCKGTNRDTDTYCRNCGCLIQSNKNYIITNVISIFLGIGILFMILLLISSYLVIK